MRRLTPSSVAVAVALLAAAIGISGCLWTTHLTCRGGPDGACSVDAYGLFTSVRHVEVAAKDIVEVRVDELAPNARRRTPGSARVWIVTRSRGSVELSGGQPFGDALFIDDALRASAAIRAFGGRAPGAVDVDVWVGPWAVYQLVALFFVMLFGWLFVTYVRGDRDEHDATS